jgi:hypothetical protein
VKRSIGLLLGLVLVFGVSGSASAGSIPCDDPATCGWTISVGDEPVGAGSYSIDENGNISFGGFETSGDGYTVSIGDIGGNVDPEITFGIGATNNSGGFINFAFAFSVPLGGFEGLIDTFAELGQTLTSASGSTGTNLFPTLGGGLIMDSQDIRISPFSSVDKQVDVGDSLFAADGTTVLDLDSASGQILLSGGGYDVMAVTVAFGLDTNGGVGLSGRVRQTLAVIPEPGIVTLGSIGLFGLWFAGRRRAA